MQTESRREDEQQVLRSNEPRTILEPEENRSRRLTDILTCVVFGGFLGSLVPTFVRALGALLLSSRLEM